MSCSILKQLNELNPDMDFVDAPDGVISNEDEEPESSLPVRGGVGLCVGTTPTGLNLAVRDVGRRIAEGYREKFHRCEILCKKTRKGLSLAAYDLGSGKPVSKILHCEGTGGQGVDESCFIWIGPAAVILTAWSDNDNAQCQVITVELLRDFAERYGRGRRKRRKGKKKH